MKHTFFKIAQGAGLFSLVRRSSWRSRRLLILCYHGISLEDEHEWASELYISPQMFKERLQLLKDEAYSVLPLEDAVRRLYSDSLPEGSVSITFDDGMYDFYARAFPVLQKFGFPATVYLTTYYCENNLPIFALTCSYILWKRRAMRLAAKVLPFVRETVELKDNQARIELVNATIQYADENKLSAIEKNELVAKLADVLNFDFNGFCSKRLLHLLTPTEVTELSMRGIDFELHTHRHRTPVDKLLFERELRDNRDRIQRFAGTSPVHFCYPNGEIHAEFLPWLAEANVASATTCHPDLASHTANPLQLPRFVDTSSHTQAEFESWLTGFRCFLPRRRVHARPVN